jgi:K+/H+ antiporter YhaU regulatory subunit KhtT
MSFELLGRIQQELSITGSAVYETVLALAERANRKVQVLRLHGHASILLNQIEQAHGELGRKIVTLCTRRPSCSHESTMPSDQLGHVLSEAGDRVQQLRQTLLSVDSRIRDLKQETIQHELLTLQQDLSLRATAIERFPVIRGSAVIGKAFAEIPRPASIRLVTVLRGPLLIPPDDVLVLRADDILVIIGLREDLAVIASEFLQSRSSKPGKVGSSSRI